MAGCPAVLASHLRNRALHVRIMRNLHAHAWAIWHWVLGIDLDPGERMQHRQHACGRSVVRGPLFRTAGQE